MLGKFVNDCEDSLTAAVITHLLHLPSEVFWQILRKACCTNSLPERAGEPQDLEFWPRWDGEDTGNAHSVIPDAFVSFAAFDLIIEAKRWDYPMQDPGQWKRELVAYANVYGEDRRLVHMLALGGLIAEQDETVTHEWSSSSVEGGDEVSKPGSIVCVVHMCKWASLLDQCQRMRQELKRLQYPSSQTFATKRTLDDIIDLFGRHGYSTGRWFRDFEFDQYRLSPSTEAQCDLFRKFSNQLSNR